MLCTTCRTSASSPPRIFFQPYQCSTRAACFSRWSIPASVARRRENRASCTHVRGSDGSVLVREQHGPRRDRVTAGQRGAQAAVEDRRPGRMATIYTIGHGARSTEELLHLLKEAQIAELVDV